MRNMRQFQMMILAVVAIMALTVGCARGPNDDALATAVKAKLFSDPELKAANIDVTVKNGEATITGEVPSSDLQLKAYKLIEGTAGIAKVNDQVKVQVAQVAPPPAPVEQPVTPAPAPVATEPPPVEKPAPVAKPVRKPAAPPEPTTAEIPAGTQLSVRMIDSIDSGKNRTGETFRAALSAPITVSGRQVVPSGTDVTVRLASAKGAGRVKGSSELELQLAQMRYGGQSYQLVSNAYQQKGKGRGKETAVRTGIGAGIGAAIGAIAGGGKGAGIGAAIGGGGAGAYQILTHGKQIKIPSETQLAFNLQAPVTVPVTARSAPARQSKQPKQRYQY